MPARERPVVVSTRVSPRERGLIGAIASAEGVSVCAALHSILIPAVRTRLNEIAAEPCEVSRERVMVTSEEAND